MTELLLDDDLAAEAGDEWVQFVKDGVAPNEATARVLEEYGADEPVVVLALAETQWRWGRLDPAIRSKALGILRGVVGSPQRGNEPAQTRKLLALEAKLEGPPPKPRSVRTVTVPEDWRPGEILSWRAMDQRFALMRVVGTERAYGKTLAPTCELLDWYDLELPAKRVIRALALRSATDRGGKRGQSQDINPLFTLGVFRAGEYPRRRLRRLRIETDTSPRTPSESIGVPWADFDEFLARRFSIGWTRGTVVAMRGEEGSLHILQVLAVRWTPFHNLEVTVSVLDWREARLPTEDEIVSLKDRPSRRYPDRAMKAIALAKPRSPGLLSNVGWRELPSGTPDVHGTPCLEWDVLQKWLADNNPEL